MKKAIALFAAVVMLVAFASVSFATSTKAPKGQITGDVTAFEAGKSITVKSKDAEVTADAVKKTKITGEVKVGSTVTMKFTESSGVKVAKKIVVKKAAAAAPAAAPKAAPAAAPKAAPAAPASK